MENFNFDFKAYEPKDSDFKEIHPLSTVAKALGAIRAGLANQGNGNFVILEKADGTSTTIRASKKLTDAHLPTAQIGLMKEPDAAGKPVYIVVRPAGESSVVSNWVTFN